MSSGLQWLDPISSSATALPGQSEPGPTHRLPWARVGTISWLARTGRVLAFMRAR